MRAAIGFTAARRWEKNDAAHARARGYYCLIFVSLVEVDVYARNRIMVVALATHIHPSSKLVIALFCIAIETNAQKNGSSQGCGEVGGQRVEKRIITRDPLGFSGDDIFVSSDDNIAIFASSHSNAKKCVEYWTRKCTQQKARKIGSFSLHSKCAR